MHGLHGRTAGIAETQADQADPEGEHHMTQNLPRIMVFGWQMQRKTPQAFTYPPDFSFPQETAGAVFEQGDAEHLNPRKRLQCLTD